MLAFTSIIDPRNFLGEKETISTKIKLLYLQYGKNKHVVREVLV